MDISRSFFFPTFKNSTHWLLQKVPWRPEQHMRSGFVQMSSCGQQVKLRTTLITKHTTAALNTPPWLQCTWVGNINKDTDEEERNTGGCWPPATHTALSPRHAEAVVSRGLAPTTSEQWWLWQGPISDRISLSVITRTTTDKIKDAQGTTWGGPQDGGCTSAAAAHVNTSRSQSWRSRRPQNGRGPF